MLDLDAKSLTVTGNLGMYGGSRIKMTQAAAYLRVDGTYDSNPGNDVGDTFMTNGLLELKGNMSALNACCGQSFRAVGAHITRFSGSSGQTVNFTYTEHNGRSTFGHVQVTNLSGVGVSTVNGMWVLGTFTNDGRFTIPLSQSVNVQGLVVLGSTSTTTATGVFNRLGGCTAAGGATTVGFTCP